LINFPLQLVLNVLVEKKSNLIHFNCIYSIISTHFSFFLICYWDLQNMEIPLIFSAKFCRHPLKCRLDDPVSIWSCLNEKDSIENLHARSSQCDPSHSGSCDHLRPSHDSQHSAETEVESAFVEWNLPLYLLLHSRFDLLDTLCEHSPRLCDFAIPIKSNYLAVKWQGHTVPGPLSLYKIYYSVDSLLESPGVERLAPEQLEYVLRNSPQLINFVQKIESKRDPHSETTLCLTLSRALHKEDPRPQILVDSGADMNYSPE